MEACVGAHQDFGFRIGVPDREYHDVSLAIVDNGFWWRTDMQRPRTQGLEFIDLVEHLALRGWRRTIRKENLRRCIVRRDLYRLQGERSDARHGKTVSLSSTRVYRQRARSM